MLFLVSEGRWLAEQLAQGALGGRVGLFDPFGCVGHVPHGCTPGGGDIAPGDGRRHGFVLAVDGNQEGLMHRFIGPGHAHGVSLVLL
jgi:hypothetical protein